MFELKGCTSIEKYLGNHTYTKEFHFQEEVRKLDLAIYEKVKTRFKEKADLFFSNGWSDILSAAYVLEKEVDGIISEAFLRIIANEITAATEKAKQSPNPFMEISVRDHSKTFLMYPHQGSYLPFQKVEFQKSIEDLINL